MPRRYKPVKTRKKRKPFIDKKSRPTEHPRANVGKDIPSLDSKKTGDITPKKELPEDAKKFGTAPAYNKGAYQIVTEENVKDIGR